MKKLEFNIISSIQGNNSRFWHFLPYSNTNKHTILKSFNHLLIPSSIVNNIDNACNLKITSFIIVNMEKENKKLYDTNFIQ